MRIKTRAFAAAIGLVGLAIGLAVAMDKFAPRGVTPGAGANEKAAAFIRTGDTFFIPEHSPLRSRLVVQSAAVSDTPSAMTFPATVEALPNKTTNILAPVSGKVIELDVGLGDHVARGQLLALIASADLAQAYADYDKARDAQELARKALDRAQGVAEAGGSAVKDLEVAQSAYAQAVTEFERARAAVKARGGAVGLTGAAHPLRITAPVSGSVTAMSSSPGAFINDLTAPMMTVSNLDEVWVTANVPEGAIGSIARGQPVDVTFSAYPGQVFHGRVTIVGDVLEPDTRREKIRIAFANPTERFKPNMFASATVLGPPSRRVFIPQSALVMNNDSTTVFVEVAPWTFVRRKVELGSDENDSTRVLRGIEPGARIVVKGAVLLND